MADIYIYIPGRIYSTFPVLTLAYYLKVRIQYRATSGGAEARREIYAADFQQEGYLR